VIKFIYVLGDRLLICQSFRHKVFQNNTTKPNCRKGDPLIFYSGWSLISSLNRVTSRYAWLFS